MSEIELPPLLIEAHESFDRVTDHGKYLWPSQREAYCAGRWSKAEEVRSLTKEKLEAAVGKYMEPFPNSVVVKDLTDFLCKELGL